MSFHRVRDLALAVALLSGIPCGLAAQTEDQDNVAYGTTSAEFLTFGAGARGTALGGAFAALANDASALFYNPSGTALMTGPQVLVGTFDYVAETRYSWGGVAFPFSGGARTVGFQIGTFGFDDQPVYTAEQPEGTGEFYSVNQTFAGITFAQNFSDRFSAGITAKGIFDNLGDVSGNAFAVDFGTNFHALLSGHPIKFAFVVSNLGTNLTYSGDAIEADAPRDSITGEQPVPSNPQPAEFKTKGFSLPIMFRASLAYDLLAGEANRLSLLSEFNQPNNNGAGFSLGGEWATQQVGGSNFGFALRGSYSYTAANGIGPANPDDTALNDEENLQGLAFGGGLNYAKESFALGFDYAWKYYGILGGTNFFSITLGW
jgi:hypothetical protein